MFNIINKRWNKRKINMFNVIEALWIYSSNKRMIDDEFIKSVIDMYLIDLDGYVTQPKYETIKLNNSNLICPMQYDFLEKKVIIDKKALFRIFKIISGYYRQFGDNEIYLYLAYNVEVFYSLIHELDHAYHVKKVLTDNESLESKLLGLNYYAAIGLEKTNEDYMDLIMNINEFFKMIQMLTDINNKFDRAQLCERLAEIDSTKTAIGVLEAIDSCYINVRRLIDKYKKALFYYYKAGYCNDQKIVEPTYRYINEVRKLNIKELNKYIDEKLEGHYGGAKTPEERFRLGLYVSNQEITDIKCKILGK